jgi:hypothetical protein
MIVAKEMKKMKRGEREQGPTSSASFFPRLITKIDGNSIPKHIHRASKIKPTNNKDSMQQSIIDVREGLRQYTMRGESKHGVEWKQNI